jgi:hypothetical protein
VYRQVAADQEKVMSKVVAVLVPAVVAQPRIARWIGAAIDWWVHRHSRESDLLRLAASVERDEPALAHQLRGMAMHEAAAAARH